jgi:hypothetical protein
LKILQSSVAPAVGGNLRFKDHSILKEIRLKKLLLLACALVSFAAAPAHAEETITPVKRPRIARKKQSVQVVDEEDNEEEEEVRAPRKRKKQPVEVIEEDEEEEAPAPRKRRRGGSEPAYEASYDTSYGGGSMRTSHWQVGMDIFGPALAYSFGGSYLFGDHIAVNAGISAFSISTSSSSATAILVPLSVSGLFGGPDHHFEVNAGVTPTFGSLVTSTGEDDRDRLAGADIYGFGGIGYRYWPALGGFHFRATGYIIAGSGIVTPWLGFQFGYAF